MEYHTLTANMLIFCNFGALSTLDLTGLHSHYQFQKSISYYAAPSTRSALQHGEGQVSKGISSVHPQTNSKSLPGTAGSSIYLSCFMDLYGEPTLSTVADRRCSLLPPQTTVSSPPLPSAIVGSGDTGEATISAVRSDPTNLKGHRSHSYEGDSHQRRIQR